MSSTLVQCPECNAKMKLAAQVEKVRCPRCDHLFSFASHQLSEPSGPPRSGKPTTRRRPQSQSGVSAAKRTERPRKSAEQQMPLPPARPKRSGGSSARSQRPRSSQRKSQSKQRSPSAFDSLPSESLRRFGTSLMFVGAAAFILPMFGLMPRRLAKLPPEAQPVVAALFLVLGAIVFGVSFANQFSDSVRSGMRFVKWGIYACVVLFVIVPIIALIIRSAPKNQNDVLNERFHELTRQYETSSPGDNEIPRGVPSGRRSNPPASTSDTPTGFPSPSSPTQPSQNPSPPDSNLATNPQTPASPTPQPTASLKRPTGRSRRRASNSTDADQSLTGSNTAANDPTTQPPNNEASVTGNVFDFGTSSSSPSPQPGSQPTGSGNPSSSPTMRRQPSGRGFSPSGNDSRQTLTVTLRGFHPRDVMPKLSEFRKKGGRAVMQVRQMRPNHAVLVFVNSVDAAEFAESVPLGRVTNIDEANNQVTIEP